MPARDLSGLVWRCLDDGPHRCRPNSRCSDGCRWMSPDENPAPVPTEQENTRNGM